jgi:ferredoxin-NADP reductase
MRIKFDHSERETFNVYTFYFQPEKSINYKPGQFVEITLKHKDPDSRGVKRLFTLSSSPTDSLLSITTKIPIENSSTFTKAMQNLKFSDTLTISKPQGSFLLPEDTNRPLVFVAGGIGITPFHSMFRWLESVAKKRPIKLLYAVNKEEDIIFKSTFDKLEHDVTIIVDNPSSNWHGIHGRLTPQLIIGREKPSADTLIFISGPSGMVENLNKGLRIAGIHDYQLILDAFSGYPSV